MARPLRLIAVLLLLALAALGIGACGGSGRGSGGDDATALIKDTFGGGHPIRSGRIDADLVVDLQGLARLTGPVSLHLAGPFQSNGGTRLPDFALDLDVNSGSRPVTVGAVFTAGAGYLTIEGQAFDLGKDLYATFRRGYEKAKADSAAKKGGGGALGALGIEPLRWLRDPRTKGTEDIAGTPAQHVAADVDVARFLDDVSALLGRARSVTAAGGAAAGAAVPTQLTPQQRDEIRRSIRSAKVDLWTGAKDRTLRKLALDVRLDVPADLRPKAGGLRTGRITLQVTLAQLNQPQRVAKPADARPIAELRAALAQLGLIGGGTASNGSGTATTPAPADPQAGYAQCLAQAGEDLAKVQRCADLLNR